MESLTSYSSKTIFIFFVTVFIYPYQVESNRVLRISDLCSPACREDQVCIEQSSLCTFLGCPLVRYCSAHDTLPANLVSQLSDSQVEETTTQSGVVPKPGCPVNLLRRPCVTQCRHDSDCRNGFLCCSNGCGHVCRPDTRVSQTSKRGTCPWHLIGTEGSCDRQCSSDHDCPGLQKCCQTSCGSRCTMPCFYWLSTSSSSWRLSSRCDPRYPHARRGLRTDKRDPRTTTTVSSLVEAENNL